MSSRGVRLVSSHLTAPRDEAREISGLGSWRPPCLLGSSPLRVKGRNGEEAVAESGRADRDRVALLVALALCVVFFCSLVQKETTTDVEWRQRSRYSVDLNRADAIHLTLLPGIGPALAEALVEWRREHGPFRTETDLLQVRGIGPHKAQEILRWASLVIESKTLDDERQCLEDETRKDETRRSLDDETDQCLGGEKVTRNNCRGRRGTNH